MAGKPTSEEAFFVHHKLRFKDDQPELEEVKTWMICKRMIKRGSQYIGGIGYCNDPSMDERCETPLQKSKTDNEIVIA